MIEESIQGSESSLHQTEQRYLGSSSIPQLAVAIRSTDKSIQFPAMKNVLNIIIEEPESVVTILENDIISVLNKFIFNEEKGEIQFLSSAILNLIGLRSEGFDASIRAGAVIESLIQMINV
ncbi:MAG: hypothetical protein EZS28_024093 [Streblomastix strix]|uniref:Uncharacterized protein n=1 Tax=Streblomastix strix TaxID=222440 RepID=A0A5J4VCW8_9EUKA|nr:MAG: hypothetical protein EZS28_024093 [Streblomastix strix]